jgi:DNA-binding PadR family transcriptional regulator
MSSYSFAEEWPGRGARAGKGRHGPHRHGGGPGRHGHHRDEQGANWPGWSLAEAAGLAEWALAKGRGRHGRPGRPTPDEIEELIALRRMHGGQFGGPGFFGRGPRGRGRGRARRGDVRLALLRLLAEEPRNGYQLMQTIEERSGGRWRPSPGSVYPTLAQLEDEGLIRSGEIDGSRRFEITEPGRAHLEERTGEPAPWEPVDGEPEDAIVELGPLVIQIGKAAWQVASVGDEAQRARAIEVLTETRRSLYRILAEDSEQFEDEADANAQGPEDDQGSVV